jgi:hypothetical protein
MENNPQAKTLLNGFNLLRWNNVVAIKCFVPNQDPFALFAARQVRREQERLALRKRLAELDAEASADIIAVQQLHKAYADDGDAPSVAAGPAPQARLSPMALAHERGKDMSNKEVILAVLRDAGPGGLNAGQIKAKALLKYGRDLNSNTLTVTLVRASKEGDGKPALTKCEGRQWYYVRQDEAPNLREARAPELALGSAAAAPPESDE